MAVSMRPSTEHRDRAPEMLDRLARTDVPRIVKPFQYVALVTQIDRVSDASRSWAGGRSSAGGARGGW